MRARSRVLAAACLLAQQREILDTDAQRPGVVGEILHGRPILVRRVHVVERGGVERIEQRGVGADQELARTAAARGHGGRQRRVTRGFPDGAQRLGQAVVGAAKGRRDARRLAVRDQVRECLRAEEGQVAGEYEPRGLWRGIERGEDAGGGARVTQRVANLWIAAAKRLVGLVGAHGDEALPRHAARAAATRARAGSHHGRRAPPCRASCANCARLRARGR